MTKEEKIKAYGAWCATCFFWGTTYLAIRVGVQTLPPALFAGSRFLLAGLILFIYALAKLPAAKVAMFAYVNPVVAVFCGWLILDEHVDGTVFIATSVILLGVVLVNSSRSLSAPQPVTEQPLKIMEPFKKEEP